MTTEVSVLDCRHAYFHPSDEDLLLHPSEQRSLAGDPG